jgi:hypothetical protein
MTTAVRKRPMTPTAAPPPRSIRLLRLPEGRRPGILAITKDRTTHYYVFKEIACDIGGRAFAVHRLGLGHLYHVRVGAPRDCSCECMGYLHRRRCKHVLGLPALTGHGLLPPG